MRVAMILLAAAMVVGLGASVPAEEVSPPGDVEGSTPDGLPPADDDPGAPDDLPPVDEDDQSSLDDTVPCGCGGPKAIYAAQYGTVQPPAMQQQQKAREAAEAAAAAAETE